MPELHWQFFPGKIEMIRKIKICQIKKIITYLQSEMKIQNTYNSWWQAI